MALRGHFFAFYSRPQRPSLPVKRPRSIGFHTQRLSTSLTLPDGVSQGDLKVAVLDFERYVFRIVDMRNCATYLAFDLTLSERSSRISARNNAVIRVIITLSNERRFV